MIPGFKPMLATDADLDKLTFPKLASAKLDGIRAICMDGKVYSRSLKLIPNKYVQKLFSHKDYEGLDGELIVGDPRSKAVYRDTVSGVMAHEGEPDVTFYAFDTVNDTNLPYGMRQPTRERERVVNLNQYLVSNLNGLLSLEDTLLDAGYEGLILRDPEGRYKFGRSTAKEQILLKVKRFVDAEAEIIGFEERMHNGNEATVSELGRTKRSSHQANKSGRGDLGALVVRIPESGIEFNIGTGFSDAERATIWDDRDNYLGKLAKFKFFPVGVKEAPRHPVWLGLRDAKDL